MLMMRIDAIDRGIGGTFTGRELLIGQRAAHFKVLLCFWSARCANISGKRKKCAKLRLKSNEPRAGGRRAANGVLSLADQFSRNHDEQLTYDNPPTSKNSDGFSL
jgi:hypothetical protein